MSWPQIWALSHVFSQPFICSVFPSGFIWECIVRSVLLVVMLNKIQSYSSPHPKENCLRCEISISASCFVMCLLDVILKSVCVCGLPNDVHQNFIERFGMGFFYISLSALYSTPLFTTTITTTTTTLYSSFIIYICNKSFTLIVYGRVNIYYLIMLSCVCPIRLG